MSKKQLLGVHKVPAKAELQLDSIHASAPSGYRFIVADTGASNRLMMTTTGKIIRAADIVDGAVGPDALAATSVSAGSYGSATQIPTFTVDADGRLTAAANANIDTSFDVRTQQDSGSLDSLGSNMSMQMTKEMIFQAGEGLNVAGVGASSSVTLQFSAEEATSSNKGVASFHSDNFSVSSGAVTIKDSGVSNVELVNSAIGTTNGISTAGSVALGGDLTIQGTAAEVEVAQSSGTFTVGLPNDVTITQDLVVGRNLVVQGAQFEVQGESVQYKDTLTEQGMEALGEDMIAPTTALTKDLGVVFHVGGANPSTSSYSSGGLALGMFDASSTGTLSGSTTSLILDSSYSSGFSSLSLSVGDRVKFTDSSSNNAIFIIKSAISSGQLNGASIGSSNKTLAVAMESSPTLGNLSGANSVSKASYSASMSAFYRDVGDSKFHIVEGVTSIANGVVGSAASYGNLKIGALEASDVDLSGAIRDYDGSAPTDGQILIGHASNGDFAKGTISAGSAAAAGSNPLSVTLGAGSVQIQAHQASASQLGVASFDSGDFSVSSGAVTVKAKGIDAAQVALAQHKVLMGQSGGAAAESRRSMCLPLVHVKFDANGEMAAHGYEADITWGSSENVSVSSGDFGTNSWASSAAGIRAMGHSDTASNFTLGNSTSNSDLTSLAVGDSLLLQRGDNSTGYHMIVTDISGMSSTPKTCKLQFLKDVGSPSGGWTGTATGDGLSKKDGTPSSSQHAYLTINADKELVVDLDHSGLFTSSDAPGLCYIAGVDRLYVAPATGDEEWQPDDASMAKKSDSLEIDLTGAFENGYATYKIWVSKIDGEA